MTTVCCSPLIKYITFVRISTPELENWHNHGTRKDNLHVTIKLNKWFLKESDKYFVRVSIYLSINFVLLEIRESDWFSYRLLFAERRQLCTRSSCK